METAWLSHAVDLVSQPEAGLAGGSPRGGLVPAPHPAGEEAECQGPHGSPCTAGIGAQTPALPCRTLLLTSAASAWEGLSSEALQVQKGMRWASTPRLRLAARV